MKQKYDILKSMGYSKEMTLHMDITRWPISKLLIIFFAAKGGEAP